MGKQVCRKVAKGERLLVWDEDDLFIRVGTGDGAVGLALLDVQRTCKIRVQASDS